MHIDVSRVHYKRDYVVPMYRLPQDRKLTLRSSGARPPLAARSRRAAAPGSSSGTLLWRLQRRLALQGLVLPPRPASLQNKAAAQCPLR